MLLGPPECLSTLSSAARLGALFLLAGALAGNASTSESPLKVFIFAGQSNMAGVRSVVADLQNPELAQAQKNYAFKDGAWLPLAPGNTQNVLLHGAPGRAERSAQGFGPEVSFAHHVSRALGEAVGVVKFAVGSTNLHVQWQPDPPGNLYQHLRGLVHEAGEKRPIEVIGMFWMQGERDAGQADHAAAYKDNLRKLVETSRRDFGNPDMIFVAGRINPPDSKNPEAVQAVRRAQAEAQIEGYAWVDCDDLSKVSDRLHYDTRGIEELGQRMARAFLRLYEKPPYENTPEPSP